MVIVYVDTSRAFLFSTPFRSTYHAGTFILRQICLNIKMDYNSFDPYNCLGMERFSHLKITTKYKYLMSITILIPTVGFFDTFILLIYL